MDIATSIACLNPPGISIRSDQIASYIDGLIKVRFLDTLQTRLVIALNSPEFCSRRIHSLQFSPSGQKLLIANENEVKIFNLEDNDWSAEIKDCVDIKSVYWGQTDDEVLVFTDFSLKLTIWSLSNLTGTHILYPKYPDSRCYSYRPGSNQLSALSKFDNHDSINLICSSCIVRRWPTTITDAQGIKWSPCGNLVAIWDSGIDYRIIIYSADGIQIRDIRDPTSLGVRSIDWSDEYLIAAGFDGVIRAYHSGTFLPVIRMQHMSLVRCDAQVWREVRVEGNSYYEEGIQPFLIRSTKDLSKTALLMAFSANNQLILSRTESLPNSLWIWSLYHLSPIAIFVHLQSVKLAEWHPRISAFLAMTCIEGSDIYLWCIDWDEPKIISVGVEITWIRWVDSNVPILVIGNKKGWQIGLVHVDEFLPGEEYDEKLNLLETVGR